MARSSAVVVLSMVLLAMAVSAVVLPVQVGRSVRREKERRAKVVELLGGEEAYRAMQARASTQTFYFTQRLDHFAVSAASQAATFQQRYFVNDSFWDPANPGPVFVQLGEEAIADVSYVNGMAMGQYGSRVNALLVGIEHRGYGKSGFGGSMSTANLAYLSVDQGLADFAAVIRHVQAVYNAQASPVVVFGCSYIGAGASFFRQRFGHLAVGAVASSAPVQAVVDFTQYLEEVQFDINYLYGQQCVAALRNVTTRIGDLLVSSAGQAEVVKTFEVCKPFTGSLDVQTFWSAVVGNPWMGASQYYSEGAYPTVQSLCANLTAAADPMDAFVTLSKKFNNPAPANCLDASYADTIQQLQTTQYMTPYSDARSWTWQTCSQFGYFQSTDSPYQPFGNGIPVQYYIQMCNDVFGFKFDLPANIDNTNNKFGGQNLPEFSYTNVAFDGARYGVWETLAPQQAVGPTVPLFLYESEGHCGGVFPLTESTPSDIVEVHHKVFAEIEKWLAQFYVAKVAH